MRDPASTPRETPPKGVRRAAARAVVMEVLLGRWSEREKLDQLVDAVRAGQSRALVVRGEPGLGKTALLEYASERAVGCRVARASGVQSEMELPFAGLHQLCQPMLDRLDRLPDPQRNALAVAFGLSSGDAPDRFLVGSRCSACWPRWRRTGHWYA
jgi:AAA ATPase domain